MKNFSVGVYENDWQIIFLKKILPWWADKSYWIYVAQLAGLPKEIIQKAKEIEKTLDKSCDSKKVVVNPLFDMWNVIDEKTKEKLQKYEQLKEKLESLDIYNITPIKALEILDELRKDL